MLSLQQPEMKTSIQAQVWPVLIHHHRSIRESALYKRLPDILKFPYAIGSQEKQTSLINGIYSRVKPWTPISDAERFR